MSGHGESSPLGTLRRLARAATAALPPGDDACALCTEAVAPRHRHLLEVAAGEVRCACYPCSILFAREEASDGRYRLIPDRRLALPDFALDGQTWARLKLPDLAFFVVSTPDGGAVACYPGRTGATRSRVPRETWAHLVERDAAFGALQADVEALLVDRHAGRNEAFLVPIDDCLRLVSLMRLHWRGRSGGEDFWHEIDRFLDGLAEAAQPGTAP